MRKLASYVLLSVLSFSVFTTLFHTVAHAQTSDFIIGPSIFPSTIPVIPTPTIMKTPGVKKAEQAHESTVKFTLQSVDVPTPTAAAKEEEPTPTPAQKQTTKTITTTTDVVDVTPTTVPTAEPTPTATPIPQPAVAAPADLEPLFEKYAQEYKVDKEDLKRIAKCEAGFNSQSDTGLYAGMYQFNVQTWSSTRNAMGLDPNPDLRKNAEESIRTAAYKILNGGRGSWPNC
jgi:hypothetical protein